MPPVVSLARPAASAAFPAGAGIVLEANAADPDGDVAKVDYYLGSVAPEKKLNTRDITAPPFRLVWKGAKAGTHSIIAVATDDTGQSATSEAVTITVKP